MRALYIRLETQDSRLKTQRSKSKRQVYSILRLASCVLCLVFSMMIFASALSGATDNSQQLEKLEQDKERIKQEKIRVDREKSNVAAKESSVLGELKRIERQLSAKEREVRVYEGNLTQCERDIRRLRKALEEAERRSKETRAQMDKRLVALYKFGYGGGQLSYLKLLLGAGDVSDLTTRYKYMSAIAIADKELLDKVVAQRAEINLKKEEVEDRKNRILKYKAGTERVRKEILNKRQERQRALDRLRKSKKTLDETLAELERSVNEIESLIVQLRRSPEVLTYEEITDLGKERGRLPWPVSGRIIGNSAPSMKGVTIQAQYGANIRCIANGIIDYARWFDGVGFGQMVIIDHGNGYRTLYAHASELLVKEGQKVKGGQVIAKVGDTGSIKGPILYFEIWKGATAMSTRQWLR